MSISSLNHLLAQKRYDEALQVAESLLSLDSSQGLVWKAMGEIFEHQGRSMEALGAMEYAAELLPEDKQAQLNRVKALFYNDQFERAAQHCQSLAQHWSELPDSYEVLGLIESHAGHDDKAEQYFNKTLTLDDKRLAARVGVARIVMNKGCLTEAELHFRKAIRLLLSHQQTSLTAFRAGASEDELLHSVQKAASSDQMEKLLWQTLAKLAEQDIHAFATGSTLLGLIRDQRLLESVAHLSIAMPYQMFSAAQNVLLEEGWLREKQPMPVLNPVSFIHPATGCGLRMFGLRINPEAGQVLSGTWIKGLPDHWQQITRLPFPVSVHQQDSPAGKVWVLDNPESWLKAMFGSWKKADPGFDMIVCAANQKSFSLLTRCFGYRRLITFIKQGDISKALAIAIKMRQHMPDDQMIRELVLFLYEEEERQNPVGAVFY